MKRKIPVQLIPLALITFTCGCHEHKQQPNIIFLLTDDQRYDAMGDNGFFLGEHGLADKWFPYEESVRVPLNTKT